MAIIDYTAKVLGLSKTIKDWQSAIAELTASRRKRVAGYCDQIADTLARAADAYTKLERNDASVAAQRQALGEFGRLTGYIENIATTLADDLDGRKLAGIKKRLEYLVEERRMVPSLRQADARRIGRLIEAEGYFRALADGLRI